MRIRKVIQIVRSDTGIADAIEKAKALIASDLFDGPMELHVVGEADGIERVRATAQKVERRRAKGARTAAATLDGPSGS